MDRETCPQRGVRHPSVEEDEQEIRNSRHFLLAGGGESSLQCAGFFPINSSEAVRSPLPLVEMLGR